jgi:hypothetical protein
MPGVSALADGIQTYGHEIISLIQNFLPDGLQDSLSASHGARQKLHTIGQQITVTGWTNVALHHRPIRPHFLTAGYLTLDRQLREPLIEFLQRLGLDQIRPTDQGRVVWNCIQIHPIEVPQS